MRRTAIVAALVMTLSGVSALPSVAQSAPPPDANFQKVTLNDQPGEPMDLAVLPDGSVLHTTRRGEIWYHDADNGINSLAATIEVYQHDEEGLQSIALDPRFGKSRRHNWVYIYYSPPLDTPVDDPATPQVNEGDAPETGTEEDFAPFEGVIRLSRFRFSDGEIDLDTEQQVLDVPVDRGICCHVGGDIVFDARGNLILSTGDDTNPFQSDGYAPIDERPERNPAFDAQRSAANTNDLRGKLLRITPSDRGGYTIPRGNLFRSTPGTRPEIYAMGFRNPFRIEIDPRSGNIYVGDYSPDAQQPDPARGPAGHGRWVIVDEPGNYGWPYCVAPDLPYIDYDFATEQSGEPFDCANPVNESPNNTGLTQLPPVEDPEVRYSYGVSPEFPELESGGIGPMAGPVYDFDRRSARERPRVAWPEYYEGKPLFYEWTRDYIKAFTLEDGEVAAIEPVVDSIVTDNPMDLEFGSNGALYMLEYGDGFFSENPDAQLSRIDYIGPNGNHTPEVEVSASATNGPAPLTVQFSSEVSDADGDELRYAWDFDGDGRVDSREQNPSHTYTGNGVYLAHLTVTDVGRRREDRGRFASDYVEIIVGNVPPVVEFVTPQEGDTFSFGDAVAFEVQVTDDQPVDCGRVQVTYILGHDEHGHPQTTAFGCTGTIQTTLPSGHDPDTDDLHGVFVAEYTDPGGEGVPQLTGSDEVVLEPAE